MKGSPNRLIHESSPYLLQHAYNPVDWHPWGEEALAKAKQEDKPMLVSIGYSACHWCHVMERESFEDDSVAEIMNRDFICIKIDREERPDLDHIYMDALQAMAGSGGWPLNIFLTPDGRPFYGGTYFPPRAIHNRPSWKDVLHGVATAYHDQKAEVLSQAEQMLGHLQNTNNVGSVVVPSSGFPQGWISDLKLKEIRDLLMQSADTVWGGFGRAPKFPQTFIIQYLMMYDHFFGDPQALQQARLSMDKMMQGGIYDHVGGGFARYSTDSEWLVPHFEKMTYDNALLAIALSDLYKITANFGYAETLSDTLSFMTEEMTNAEAGFYSALDADSEGEEGKFYTWSKADFTDAIGAEGELIAELYDITETGNWEYRNIPWLKQPVGEFAKEKNIDETTFRATVRTSLHKLRVKRKERVAPGLDDKCLLGWNALMNIALTKAYTATGENKWLAFAERNMEFMLNQFQDKATSNWYHTFKNGTAKYPAFLDDLAFLVKALIILNEITGNKQYRTKAIEITDLIVEQFADVESPLFFYTGVLQQDVILRKKEWHDGALPSANAVMAENLKKLGILSENEVWKGRAAEMLFSLHEYIHRYPNALAYWACVLMEHFCGTMEVAMIGKDVNQHTGKVWKKYIPNMVLQFSKTAETDNPLLNNKPETEETIFYLCRDYSCLQPVKNPEEFIQLLEKEKIT